MSEQRPLGITYGRMQRDLVRQHSRKITAAEFGIAVDYRRQGLDGNFKKSAQLGRPLLSFKIHKLRARGI